MVPPNGSKRQLKILTVGDGDLTLSLALARAYGGDPEAFSLSLTASVLDSHEDDLRLSFPNAPLQELSERNVTVLYSVDATQLHRHHQHHHHHNLKVENVSGDNPCDWDIVLFHHPHLGLFSLNDDEGEHAQRHYELLCHYLYSASRVSNLVHVCLCGTQRTTWKMDDAAQRQGLTLIHELSTAVPISQLWTAVHGSTNDEDDEDDDDDDARGTVMTAAPPLPHHAAPRKFRCGKLGSRHFLGKYGYCHRRTAGERYRGGSFDMNVQGSMHYVFVRRQQQQQRGSDTTTRTRTRTASETLLPTSQFSCFICGRRCASRGEWEQHMAAPARPHAAELSNHHGPDVKIHDTAGTSKVAVLVEMSAVPVNGSINGSTIDQENISHRTSCSPAVDCPTDVGGQQEYEAKIVVPLDSHGKRLRWFLQHNTLLSKRQADVAVQSGRVLIDGVPVRDTSRNLKAGMSVVVCSAVLVHASTMDSATGQAQDPPEPTTVGARVNVTVISRQFEPYLIVQKPSGMRTKGSTIPGSLEFVVARQEGRGYECLSRLDTSTLGICALVPNDEYSKMTLQNKIPPPEIIHSMVALLHGRIPEDWTPHHYHEYSTTSTGGIPRKWNKRKHLSEDTQSSGTAAATESSSTTTSRGSGVTIFPLERSSDASTSSSGISALSTVRIETTFPSAATICHVMRRLGYPVVGDTNCRREYLELKRSIRNRIKNKICLINHQVTFVDVKSDEKITVPPTPPPLPDKLSAHYWDIHFGTDAGVIAPTND